MTAKPVAVAHMLVLALFGIGNAALELYTEYASSVSFAAMDIHTTVRAVTAGMPGYAWSLLILGFKEPLFSTALASIGSAFIAMICTVVGWQIVRRLSVRLAWVFFLSFLGLCCVNFALNYLGGYLALPIVLARMGGAPAAFPPATFALATIGLVMNFGFYALWWRRSVKTARSPKLAATAS